MKTHVSHEYSSEENYRMKIYCYVNTTVNARGRRRALYILSLHPFFWVRVLGLTFPANQKVNMNENPQSITTWGLPSGEQSLLAQVH